jgi:hypothetical protein
MPDSLAYAQWTPGEQAPEKATARASPQIIESAGRNGSQNFLTHDGQFVNPRMPVPIISLMANHYVIHIHVLVCGI